MPGRKEEDFKDVMYFHYITYMAISQRKNPSTGVHDSYNLGRPFLCYLYYILILSDLCQQVEKKIFLKKLCIYTMYLIQLHPSTRTPAPEVMKFTIVVDPSLVIINVHLICWKHAPEQRRKFFKITSILHFLPQNYLPLGRGVMTFTISCLFTLQIIHFKFA